MDETLGLDRIETIVVVRHTSLKDNPPVKTFTFTHLEALVAILVLACIATATAFLYVQAKRRREQREAERVDRLASDIRDLFETLARLSSFDSGYLMKKDFDQVLHSPTLAAIKELPERAIESSAHAKEIAYILQCCQNPDYRALRNKGYKEHELARCNTLFSDIDGGKSLDPQQRNAIVTDEYSNLVVAGAGSGKTSVVVGKVKYLIRRWGIDPSQILVTSFTRASVDDLKRRIEADGITGVSARTFHSLGLKVLGNDVAVAPENALTKHVTTYLSEELTSHPYQASAFVEFFGLWSLTADESLDTREAETRMKILKAQDMRTLKGFIEEAKYPGTHDTLLGERVKSLEEVMIANFLFLNGVAYEYEKPYPYEIPEKLYDERRRAYQPDFYLVDYDIWLEHFGIDEHGRVPWMKTAAEEKNYLDGIDWKRKVHKACGTTLIESYSYWNTDQDLLNQLEALLRRKGVKLVLDPRRNAEICGRLLKDRRFFSSMAQLISTFISLTKSSNRTAPEVDEIARRTYQGDGAMWHRYDLFTRFAWPIYTSYQASLSSAEKPLVDFDDMINKAAERIREEGYDTPYRYIIVDEYQDISLSRFGLLSAIRDACGAKLVCVGDDWQAIYRFAGSDVTLFTNFGKLVGPYEEMRIERTYRNSQPLVDAASRFVLKNPDQLKKTVTSMVAKPAGPPIAAIALEDQRAAFTFALNDLLKTPNAGGDILVLGRNRRDLERVFGSYEPTGNFSFRNPKRNNPTESKFDQVIIYKPQGGPRKEIGYMTVHKSKGLQADNVIVVGLVNDRYGFPNMVADDPILELLLADSDRYDFAEERRLFYVALTRTKNKVWLISGEDAGYPGKSLFVDELRHDCDDRSFASFSRNDEGGSATCPRCGGILLKRSGPSGSFIGCSNYPFCDKTYRDVRILEDRKKCPRCGGYLTRRNRRDGSGEFYGCTNYPNLCTYTMNLDGSTRKDKSTTRTNPAARATYRQPPTSRPVKQNQDTAPRCPLCSAPMALRSGPYGKFWGCTTYPNCTGKRDFMPNGSTSTPTSSRRPNKGNTIPNCPDCGAPMVLRTGKYGPFYGCSKYPSCTGTRNLPTSSGP